MQDSILIFGGGQLQLSIIGRVKKKGFNAIVIDPDPNAPGKEIADKFFEVGGNDFSGTRKIALDHKIKGIVTSATDKPILMMCRLAEDFGFAFPTYNSCETVLDKGKFKTFLQEHNFPHAKGVVYQDTTPIDFDTFLYPVIVKPVMNSGSRGVLKCDRPEKLADTIRETIAFCIDGRYLIEEYIEGDEISVEAIVHDHKVIIFQLTDKIVTLPPYNVELGHIQPSKYEYLKEDINSLLQEVVAKAGLNNCALHPELKIKNDQITIIEIGPRLGGDFITSHLVPLSTGVNMEDIVIDIATGKTPHFTRTNRASMVSYFNFGKDKETKLEIPLEYIRNQFPEIKHLSFGLTVGERTHTITNSLNRYGEFVIQESSRDLLLSSKRKIEHYIEQYIF